MSYSIGMKFGRANSDEKVIESPFDGLKKHSKITKKAINELIKGIQFYTKGEFKKAQTSFEKVSKLENQADEIKIEIRENLPRFIFLPLTRDEFLRLLKEADSILDYAEDVGVFLMMREEELPEEIREDFKIFTENIFKSAKLVDDIVAVLVEMLKSSFGEDSEDKIRELQLEIAVNENEADMIERKISRKLFNHDENPLKAVHFLKVVDKMDSIADHAENVGDMIDSIVVSK